MLPHRYGECRVVHHGKNRPSMAEMGHSRRSGGQQGFAECPLCLAGSTGRRNTGVKSLGWGFECQGLTWPFI